MRTWYEIYITHEDTGTETIESFSDLNEAVKFYKEEKSKWESMGMKIGIDVWIEGRKTDSYDFTDVI